MLSSEKGFTLIEVLIVIAIVGLIYTSIANVHLAGFRVWNYSKNKIDNKQVSRMINDRISPFIREALEVKLNNSKDVLEIYFNEKDNEYNGIRYGLNNDYEFYYQKHKLDNSWGNKMTLTSSEMVIIKNLKFSIDINKNIINIEMDIINKEIEKKFSQSIFLRFEDVTINIAS